MLESGKVKGPFIRGPYNYDMDAVSKATGSKIEGPSLAKQQFAEECDINTIVRRFGLTGELPEGVRMPTYGDFTMVKDFKSAMDALALANEAFEEMPAEVRARFHNSTEEFVAFCSDDANLDEAIKLGLVPPKTPSAAAPKAPGAVAPSAPAASPAAPASAAPAASDTGST